MPGTAVAGVEVVNREGEFARPGPLCEQARIGVRTEQQVTWRGEFAGDDQLRDSGFGSDLRRRHGALPSCELCRPMPVPRQSAH